MREPRVRLIISSTVLPFITVLSSSFCSFHSLSPLSPSPNWAPFFDLYKQVMWEAKVPHNTSQRVWLPPTLSRQCENVMEFFKLILFFPFFPLTNSGPWQQRTHTTGATTEPANKENGWLVAAAREGEENGTDALIARHQFPVCLPLCDGNDLDLSWPNSWAFVLFLWCISLR